MNRKSAHSISLNKVKGTRNRDRLKELRRVSLRNQLIDQERIQVIASIDFFLETLTQLHKELNRLNAELGAGINQYTDLYEQFEIERKRAKAQPAAEACTD